MLVSLTVGKVDAGVTVLLTPDKRLIEFPSILLPPDISSGSIVDITVGQNTAKEAVAQQEFRELQDQIYNSFGASSPSTPVLRCRNATQTSVVLEWDPIQLATADLISLALFPNGQKAGNIPRPTAMHSTKISGLAVDTEYAFHLVLRTTAGTYSSDRVVVRTHKMTDLSGITITTGILPAAVKENLSRAVERIGAKIVDGVRIDTTHFVTTEGRGVMWEKANELNIPVVRPEWVDACEKNGRILGVTKFYLDALRPGPSDTEMTTSMATATRPGTAGSIPQVQSPREKDLPRAPAVPPPPPKEDQQHEAPTNDGATAQSLSSPEAPAPDKESSPAEDDADVASTTSSSTGDDDGPEDKVRQDEQKIRADEREEQGLATRPKPATVDEADDDADSVDDTKQEAAGKDELSPVEKGKKSPDGSSFQDVAL